MVLQDSKQVKRQVPCFVLEIEAAQAVVAVPGSRILSEGGEWLVPQRQVSESASHRAYVVDGVQVGFHRVEISSLRETKPKGTVEEWQTAEGVVKIPPLGALQRMYFGSDAEGLLTETEAEERTEGDLLRRLAALEAENKHLQEAHAQFAAQGAKDTAKKVVGEQLTRMGQAQRFNIDDSGDEEFTESEEEEGAAGLLQRLARLGGTDAIGKGTQGAASVASTSPRRRRRSPADAARGLQGRRGVVGEGTDLGPRKRLTDERADPPSLHELLQSNRAPGVDVNGLVQLEILKLLEKMSKKSHDNEDGAEGLDGLRAVRTLERMRTLQKGLKSNPAKIIRIFEEEWAEEIGGSHKLWTWGDAAGKIKWGKFRSMLRVWTMLAAVKKELETGPQNLKAEAQLVQCMKATHQFALSGSWKTAWPYTFLQDPIESRTHAGTQVEAEAILGMLRTKDDLQKRMKGATRDLAEPSDEEGEAEGKKHPKGPKKHV